MQENMFHVALLLLLAAGMPEPGTGTSIKMDFLSSGTVRRNDNHHDHNDIKIINDDVNKLMIRATTTFIFHLRRLLTMG